MLRPDSHEVTKWIEGNGQTRGPIKSIIEGCRKWLDKRWEARIKYVYKEQNEVVDTMAKAAAQGNDQWKDLNIPLQCSMKALSDDRVGLPSTRFVRVEH